MERHGSESFFVLGEGFLGETVGGREPRLAADAVADTPPFRFSRMGPKGASASSPSPTESGVCLTGRQDCGRFGSPRRI
jgi:hypothetical protein